MFDNMIPINDTIVSLETALRIELSGDLKVKDTVDAAVERLENTFAVTFDTDVFTLIEESQLTESNLQIFMRDLQMALSRMSFLTDLKLFHCNLGIALSDVNYLGFGKDRLLTALKYLQEVTLYNDHADELMPPLTNALDNIGMCTIKRLFIVLLVLHRIGVKEGVSVLARFIYIGGLLR